MLYENRVFSQIVFFGYTIAILFELEKNVPIRHSSPRPFDPEKVFAVELELERIRIILS